MRIADLGNAGSGKSTLAAKLSAELDLPLCEIDTLLWREGWTLAPIADYTKEHDVIISSDRWIVDGLGMQDSIAPRVERATHIVLCDFPIWQNYWLLSERDPAPVSPDT